MTASDIAKALGGHRNGSNGFLARCPVATHGRGEGDRRPSLSIRDGDKALLVRCFAGCDPRDVIDELRRRGLLDKTGQIGPFSSSRSALQSTQIAPIEPEPDADALELWQSASLVCGTLGETYLRSHRRLTLDPPPSIRFLENAVYPHTGHAFPAIVAAVQRPDRTIIAVQVTYLRPSHGAKAPVHAPRLTVGRLGTGAIRLAAATDVLGLAEGLETGLSAMQLSGIPCWTTLGGQRLGKITIPATVRELHIFGDDDAAGRLAADTAAGRYTRAGLRVVLRWPPQGFGDWNDVLRARASGVAA